MRYRPTTIREKGLQSHLDTQSKNHNNFGYNDFVTMYTNGVNISNIARAFGVNRNTVRKWVLILLEKS